MSFKMVEWEFEPRQSGSNAQYYILGVGGGG